MNEGKIALLIMNLIMDDEQEPDENDGGQIVYVRTFEDVGVVTNNEGLVIQTRDGSRFQLTIVQCR